MRNCYDAHQGCARPKDFLVQPIIIVIVRAPVLVYALEMTHAYFPSQPEKCSASFIVSCLQITHYVFSISRSYQWLTSMHARPRRDFRGMASRATGRVPYAASAWRLAIICWWVVFSHEVWFKTFMRCGFQQLAPTPNDEFVDWRLWTHKGVSRQHRKAFDSLVVLVVWNLWLQRNGRVFRTGSLVALALVQVIFE
jgi:hypothetical protein